MKICQQCGKEFDPVNERPSHPAKYCSRLCRDKAQTKRITLVCRQCGKEFQRQKYMETWSQERGPFCGFQCYGLWQKKQAQGENNPNFVDHSNVRWAGQWERNRAAVLERDGYRCVHCGSSYRLHVHHKTAWEPDQDDPHQIDNMETLCSSCHRKQHPTPHGDDGKFCSDK